MSDSDSDAAAGWYPDPAGSGWQRYFDGTTWTEHIAPPPPWQAPPQYAHGHWDGPAWDGARLGPARAGPGALANQSRRFAARAIDTLILLPVLAGCLAISVSLAVSRSSSLFQVSSRPNGTVAAPGFVWVELAAIGSFLVFDLVFMAYETVATALYGRTLGKAWLHIRPVRSGGGALGWGRSLGRAASVSTAWLVNWIGLVDFLWCCWDANRQCLHDKVVDTVVINDPG